MSDDDDQFLLYQADEAVTQERRLAAARILKQVSDTNLLRPEHLRTIEMAAECQKVMDELLCDSLDVLAELGWKKQGESHRVTQPHDNESHMSLQQHKDNKSMTMDTFMFYKVNDASSAISCRIDSTLEPSLLVPLLSVLNESDLYNTWMPSWKHPKVGLRTCTQVAELGRGHQVVHFVADMPFPITNRECILHAYAVDDIDERSVIVIKLKSLDTGDHLGLTLPVLQKGNVRVDLDSGMLIRTCPNDHPLLQKSEKNRQQRQSMMQDAELGDDYSNTEEHVDSQRKALLLFSLYQQVDANVKYVPMSVINFFTRTVFSRMWYSLIEVASEVRDGKRPAHHNAIQVKPELYQWIMERADVMLKE